MYNQPLETCGKYSALSLYKYTVSAIVCNVVRVSFSSLLTLQAIAKTFHKFQHPLLFSVHLSSGVTTDVLNALMKKRTKRARIIPFVSEIFDHWLG